MTPADPASFRKRSREPGVTIEDSISRVIAGWQAARPGMNVEPIAITARLARLQATLGPRLEAVFERFGIRGADFAVLATLVRLAHARVSQRRLGLELGLTPGTISLRVDRLVRHGLVHRDADPEDGRGALLSLTDAGRELFEACAPEHLANARALLAGLTEPEREQLGALLGKLLYAFEESAPGQSPEPERGSERLPLPVDARPARSRRRASRERRRRPRG